jgi:glycogen(starch) synthase
MSKTGYQQQVNLIQEPLHGKKLKILMLTWEYPPNIIGGLSRHVYGLSVHLTKMGHEVHVITARGSDLPAIETMNGVNVYRINPINGQDESFLAWIGGLNLAFVFKAEKLAMEIPFDLIHAHDWLVGSAAIVLKDLLEIPLLATIHATEYGRNNGIHTEMQRFIHDKEKQLVSASDQLIVCSDYMKDSLPDIFKAGHEKIAVIPNGIEPPETTVTAEEIFPDLAQKKYIFSIGRMVKEKGFETIIAAAEIAREKQLDYYFVIAGKGPMLDSYRQQIIARNLEAYVQFVGYITDEERNALISGSEMAVIPSLYEPFGIAALETMILGKPTIVSNTGGMQKIVKHLQTGLWMEPGNPESLLEQIKFLMSNPDRAKEIGIKGSQMVKGLYGWDRIASETVRIMVDTLLKNRIDGC